MLKSFSFTYLSDGSQIFLSMPMSEQGLDSGGYQYFNVYEDEYLEDKIGMLGMRMSGTVSNSWGFTEKGNAREGLKSVMKLAFPLIDLPISRQQIAVDSSSHFPVLELLSEGKISYDENSYLLHMPSGQSPNEFFKSTVFQGVMNDSNVKRLILTHAYVEGLKDSLGEFMFQTIEITNDIWPINNARVTKAYRGLVEDGLLQPMGGNTSSGFPSFTKLTLAGRRTIEATKQKTVPELDITKPKLTENIPQTAPNSSYISSNLVEKLVAAAKKSDYETTKLEAILDELNDASARNKAQSAHALVRTLLNHIAPLFGYNTFAEVANNQQWSRTEKKRIHEIETLFRFDADESLHSPISKRNTAVDMQSVGLIRRTVSVILEEAIDKN